MSMQLVAYEFDGQSRVTSARIADDWTSLCTPEDFGFTALQAFLEQRAQQQMPPDVEVETTQVPASSARAEMFAEALAIIREANTLMSSARRQQPAPPAETTVSDPHRHVTVTVSGGQPAWLKINQSWLRHSDPHQVEADLVTALNRSLELTDEAQVGLAKLSQRHRRLVEQRNENWR